VLLILEELLTLTFKKKLKIPKGIENPYIEEQTTQWLARNNSKCN